MSEQTTKCAPKAQEPSDLVSFDECQKHLEKYNLPDDQVLKIKNSLEGIVNSIINSYLNEFD